MKCLVLCLILLMNCGCAGWSQSDRAFLVASTVASYADYATTKSALDRGNYEVNPILGKYPSDTRLAVTMAVSQAAIITIAYFFPKWRKWLLGGKTVINTGFAIHNSNL